METLFHLVYELAHWCLSWVFPRQGMIRADQKGVLVRGSYVRVIEPGPVWYYSRWSSVFVETIVRRVAEMLDQVLTTEDLVTIRIGGALEYEIVDVRKWIVDNEDAEHGLLIAAQRVIRDFVSSSTFEEIQAFDPMDDEDDPLTVRARRGLEKKFGVRVLNLGLTVFAETEGRDLNHTGAAVEVNISGK